VELSQAQLQQTQAQIDGANARFEYEAGLAALRFKVDRNLNSGQVSSIAAGSVNWQKCLNRAQFGAAFLSGSGVSILRSPAHQRHLRDNQPCILLIVGGDDVPGRVMSACGMKALFLGRHVLFPVFSLVNVGGTELPVLFRLIDALKESFLRSSKERCRNILTASVPLR